MFKKRIKKSALLPQITSQISFSYQYENLPIPEFEFQQPTTTTQKTLHVEAGIDSQTRFMMSVAREEKTFRISCIIKINMLSVPINRKKMQTDQRSDFNIISMNMMRKLSLELFSLNSIDFRDFIMRTADHKKFSLLHWV